MASYELPHFRFEKFKTGRAYQRPQKDMSSVSSGREDGHGSRLREGYDLAVRAFSGQNGYFSSDISEGTRALYLEVSLEAGTAPPDLNWKSQNIRLSALRTQENGVTVGALYIPESAIAFLDRKLMEYAEERTPSGKAKNDTKFSTVDSFALGDIQTLWTDSRPFPNGLSQQLWWECWCVSSKVTQVSHLAHTLRLRVNENSLSFPDTEVLLIYANTLEMTILVGNADGVEELRRATDNPYFFTRLTSREKYDWTSDLSSRVNPPAENSPAICILDNGINHAHPLLQPALSSGDCQAINESWGGTITMGMGQTWPVRRSMGI